MLVAQVILSVVLAYAVCGLAVSVPFVLRGVERVDASARDTSLLFRLLILPGTVALWPLLAAKWRNAHREGGRP
jgi:hypothetical protein